MRRFVLVLGFSLICVPTTPLTLRAQQKAGEGPKKDPKPGEKGAAAAETPGKGPKTGLEGTKWSVIYNNNNNLSTTFEFRKEGVFVCGGSLKGSWKRDGNSLRMRTSDGAEFEGVLSGDTMTGKVSVGKGNRSAQYPWKAKKE